MKKLVLVVVVMVMGINSLTAQEGAEYKVYVPMRTYHYDRNPINPYHSTEGGNIGAVVIRRKHKGILFTDTNVGVIRNSYNNISVMAHKGVGIHTKPSDIAINIGLISGYKNLFETTVVYESYELKLADTEKSHQITKEIGTYSNHKAKKLPKMMQKYGIIPSVNLSVAFNTGRVSPIFIISPEFVNAGLLIRI